jgi:Methyltransferase domain
MPSLRKMAMALYPTCFQVDANITGLPEYEARLWAKANSLRHAHTVAAIQAFSEGRKGSRIRILNASGLSAGHQDFAIAGYLRGAGVDFTWDVFESPSSKYLAHPVFMQFSRELGIDIHLSDFSKETALYGKEEDCYDIVLFTEIAEHLDHSVFLDALEAMQRKLKGGGQLMLTTPNLMSLTNRIRLLAGNGDGPYWGDGALNRQAGLYGHIVLYDMRRLSRLLKDAGFVVQHAYTFNYGNGPAEKSPVRRLAYRLVEAISRLIPNSGSTLMLIAGKGAPDRTKFQI